MRVRKRAPITEAVGTVSRQSTEGVGTEIAENHEGTKSPFEL